MGLVPARFASNIYTAELRWARRLPAHLHVAAHVDVQRRDYDASSYRGGPSIADVFRVSSPMCGPTSPPVNACVDPMEVPGFQDGLRVVHGGAGFLWDYRSHTRDGSGVGVGVDATYAEGINGDPDRHITYTAEPVAALGGLDRQIIFHGRAAMVDTFNGAPINFEELVMTAGYAGLRGFPDGRFRGESGAQGTLEYRWYVSQLVDASLFGDYGTVAGHDFAGVFSSQWFPDFGVGLRLYRTPGNYWEGALTAGVQIIYAPDNGFRVILAVANF
jgi:hypothetical protein